MNEIIFSPEAMEDYLYWQKNNPDMVASIKRLLSDIQQHPQYGIGKPEKLKYDLSGKWSRRLDSEHRIIYAINDNIINVLALRYHYSNK